MAIETAQHERQAAHQDGHDAAGMPGHATKHGRQLDEQKHASLHHGGSCAAGREVGVRRHHGAEQPGVERHLRGLGDAGERKRRCTASADKQRGNAEPMSCENSSDAKACRTARRWRTGPLRSRCRPARFMTIWRNALRMASSVLRVSDKQERADRGDLPASRTATARLFENTMTYMAERNSEHKREERRAAVAARRRARAPGSLPCSRARTPQMPLPTTPMMNAMSSERLSTYRPYCTSMP